ncbi:winged helix-turn-helix domain-containing protein [Streptomyces rimosus]|uniref:winged helix-turn-helix domain-containing protein n=1 Tax=Streptomyces rimosus TaxID=1927 RepID=UPI000D143D8F
MRELAAAAGISVSTVSYQLKRVWAQGVAIETRGRPRRCPHCGRRPRPVGPGNPREALLRGMGRHRAVEIR